MKKCRLHRSENANFQLISKHPRVTLIHLPRYISPAFDVCLMACDFSSEALRTSPDGYLYAMKFDFHCYITSSFMWGIFQFARRATKINLCPLVNEVHIMIINLLWLLWLLWLLYCLPKSGCIRRLSKIKDFQISLVFSKFPNCPSREYLYDLSTGSWWWRTLKKVEKEKWNSKATDP